MIFKGWQRFDSYWDVPRIEHHDHVKEFYLTVVSYTNFITVGGVAIALLLTVAALALPRPIRLQPALLVDLLFNQFATLEYTQFNALRDFSGELVIFMGVGYLMRI